MSLQTQVFPQKITTLFWFVTTEAMGNLSVNWTRGHSVHKWLLVLPQWGSVEMTCRRSPLDGFLLCGSVNLSPVLTLVFLHQPAGSNLGHPRGQPQVYMNLPGRLHPPLPETTSLTSSPGRILVQYPK